MGGQVSRAQVATKHVAEGVRVSSARPAVRPPGGGSDVKHAANVEAERLVRVPTPSEDSAPSKEIAPPESYRTSSDEWAALLNSMSGSISSRTWEGSVGVRSARARDAAMHAAQQSHEVRQKLPKRRLPPGVVVPEPKAGATMEDAKLALAEISQALDEHQAEELEERRGRLTQNQVLEVYRQVRRDRKFWQPEVVAKHFGLDEADAEGLLSHSRTILPVQMFGVSRGVYDPEKGIERFEDLEEKR